MVRKRTGAECITPRGKKGEFRFIRKGEFKIPICIPLRRRRR